MMKHWVGDRGRKQSHRKDRQQGNRCHTYVCKIGDLMLYEMNKDLDTVRQGLDTVRNNKGFVDFTKDQGVVVAGKGFAK